MNTNISNDNSFNYSNGSLDSSNERPKLFQFENKLQLKNKN